jgi:hypothetical protein
MKTSARELRRSAFVESWPLPFDYLTAPHYSNTLQNIWIGIRLIRTTFATLTFASVKATVKSLSFAKSAPQTGSSEPTPR